MTTSDNGPYANRPGAVDLAVDGFPQNEAEARRRGYDWPTVKRALDEQREVAECRRRAARGSLLDMRFGGRAR